MINTTTDRPILSSDGDQKGGTKEQPWPRVKSGTEPTEGFDATARSTERPSPKTTQRTVGRYIAVGLATGWTVRGSNPGGALDLCRPHLGPTQTPVQWVPGTLPGDKAPWAWRWPPTHTWRQGWRMSKAIYTPTSPLGHYGLFCSDLYVYIVTTRHILYTPLTLWATQ